MGILRSGLDVRCRLFPWNREIELGYVWHRNKWLLREVNAAGSLSMLHKLISIIIKVHKIDHVGTIDEQNDM